MKASDEYNPHRISTILHFPRKRGRPRKIRNETDNGTPELIMKKLCGETSETLDLCLERGIITPEQHWCGIHLRWLYTLRHGLPGIRAIDPTHLGGTDRKCDDQEWKIARESEYHEAIRKLMAGGHVPLIMAICVFDERPAFLQARYPKISQSASKNTDRIIYNLRHGLDILAEHWGRNVPLSC